MAPNFSTLVLKFWQLISRQKYALTSRKYALTSRKYFKTILLRDFQATKKNIYICTNFPKICTNFLKKCLKEYCCEIFQQTFGFMAHTPLTGVYNDTNMIWLVANLPSCTLKSLVCGQGACSVLGGHAAQVLHPHCGLINSWPTSSTMEIKMVDRSYHRMKTSAMQPLPGARSCVTWSCATCASWVILLMHHCHWNKLGSIGTAQCWACDIVLAEPKEDRDASFVSNSNLLEDLHVLWQSCAKTEELQRLKSFVL